MPIVKFDNAFAFVRLTLQPDEIHGLLEKHRQQYPDTPSVEAEGKQLARDGFPPLDAANFVERVCRWGHGARLIPKIRAANEDDLIASALSSAFQLARSGKVTEGVEEIRQVEYLGQSFASKQLRFLIPTRAVILDEVVRSRLGYLQKPCGYAEYLADCKAILSQASSLKFRQRSLRVCDIDAAVYMKLKEKPA